MTTEIEIEGIGKLILNNPATIEKTSNSHFDFRNEAGEPVPPIGRHQIDFKRNGKLFAFLTMDSTPPVFARTVIDITPTEAA